MEFNYRIDEIRTATGHIQSTKLSYNKRWRKEIIDLYRESVERLDPCIIILFEKNNSDEVCRISPVVLSEQIDGKRLMDLKELGIQTSIYYPLIYSLQVI